MNLDIFDVSWNSILISYQMFELHLVFQLQLNLMLLLIFYFHFEITLMQPISLCGFL